MITVDTPLKAAGFAGLVYILTAIIALFVAGIIYVAFRILHRETPKAASPETNAPKSEDKPGV